ncbi:MAG TPA: O-antigen ligase family protein [Vicinamibacterales bacterium]|nr:O-antigen ligase family protein [Vicinamibacterales bacterium]
MRLTKVVVLGSTLLAFAAHAWLLSSQHPWLWWTVAGAFGVSLAIARVSLTLGLVGPLVLAYIAPAVLMISAGTLDYSLIVVWLALVAGPIFAGSDWRGWHTPGWWTIALVAWALILALTWPVIALREIDFSLIAAGTLNTPNGLFAPAPPISAASVVLTALGQLLGLLWLDFLWSRFGTARLPQAERFVLVPMVLSVAIASAVGLYQKVVDITWLSVAPWSEMGRAAGSMFDGNSFGTAAAIWAPVTLALTWRLGWPIVVGATVTTLLAVGMWTSGSRTALLVLTFGIAAIAVALLRGSRRWYARFGSVALLAATTVVLLVIAARRADPSSPLARVMKMIPSDTEGLATLARVLWEREGYGPVATRMVADYPWTGVGVGAFPLLAPDYFFLEHGHTIFGDNAQNWWRHQIAELGLPGALPAIAVTVGILSMLLVGPPPATHRAAVTVLRGTIFGVGLASLVGMGTQHPALFLTFVTLVFWLGALLETPPRPLPPRPAWWGVVGIAMLIAAGQIYNATHDLRVPHRALAHNFTYGYGFSEPEPDPVLGMVRHTRRHAVGVIAAEHAYFQVTLIVAQATTADPVRVRLWRERDLILDQPVSGSAPLVRFVGVASGDDQLMLELDVSRTATDGTGLTFAGTWVREIPAGTHPALVMQ